LSDNDVLGEGCAGACFELDLLATLHRARQGVSPWIVRTSGCMAKLNVVVQAENAVGIGH
jgi:hypothetical protein